MSLVQRVPAPIAISFLQGLPFAAVDRPAPRQTSKVAQGSLLLMVHAARSLSIVTLGLRRIAVAGLPSPIVSIAAMLPRQAAVKILRGVHAPAEGLLVSRTLHDVSARFQGRRSLLPTLRAATQMKIGRAHV